MMRMESLLSSEMKVRSYELDAYGHVNHAVFLHYYEQARLEYLERRGLSFRTFWEEGYLTVIVRAEVDYIKPLEMSQRITIPGEIEQVGDTSIILHQEILRLPERELVSRGRFVVVFLSRETNRPVAVPDSFRQAFLNPA
jgi:YbgC/YbaW family acyl-CoA thioester hydrolase